MTIHRCGVYLPTGFSRRKRSSSCRGNFVSETWTSVVLQRWLVQGSGVHGKVEQVLH